MFLFGGEEILCDKVKININITKFIFLRALSVRIVIFFLFHKIVCRNN